MAAANFQFDTAMIDPIIQMMDKGMTLLMAAILVVASSMAVLDLSFTAFFNWSDNTGEIFVATLKKLIKYALTFGLIKIYTQILEIAYNLFADIGNLFGSGLGSPLKVQSVWDELWTELSKFLNIGLKFKDIWALLYLLLFAVGFVFLVFIITTITIAIIQFHIVGRLAIIYLACMPLDVLSDIGKKAISAIVGAGTYLMVAVALTSMGTKVLKSYPIPENIGAENNEPHTIIMWLAVFIVIAFLIKFYDRIAALILTGHGGVTGQQFGSFSGNVVAAGGSAVGGITSVIGGAAVGGLGAIAGATIGGIVAGKEGAMKGFKMGGKLGFEKGEKPGKAITTTARGAGKAIEVVTGNISLDGIQEGAKRTSKKLSGSRDIRKDAEEKKEKIIAALGDSENKGNEKKKEEKESSSTTAGKMADTKESEAKMKGREKHKSNKEITEEKIRASRADRTINKKEFESRIEKEVFEERKKTESNKETFVESEKRKEKQS